jgi:hypothetical protein
MKQTLLSISRYVIVWYANNFAAPFWMIGHYHFAVNSFTQLERIGGMIAINLITVLGIYLDWKVQHAEKNTDLAPQKESLDFFAIDRRCSPKEISKRTESGIVSRGQKLEDIVFIREDETHLYVFYKHR